MITYYTCNVKEIKIKLRYYFSLQVPILYRSIIYVKEVGQ